MSGTTVTPTLAKAALAPARRFRPSTGEDDRAVNGGPSSRRVEIRRRARAVAQGVALAPFAVFGVVMIVIAPAGVAIVAADWAFGTGALALETLVVVVLMAVTVAGLFWSVAYGGIKSLLRFGRFQPTVRASALAVFAAVSFTSLTGLLYEQGLVGVSTDPARDEVFDLTFDFYLWHLANTLPLVDIPGNLGWDKPFEFDGPLGGLLVIVFTGFVIFPLIQLARLILAAGDMPFDGMVVRALGKHVGDDRIFIVPDREGYGRAIIDQWVVIDVMRGVWNHDAAVQRLERLGANPTERRPRGYLLVADAVAEGARERIELALSEAPFEAALAVWRVDQRPGDLTAAFDALQERLNPAPPSEATQASATVA